MEKIINFLNTNRYGVMTTVDGDKPKARPFEFMIAKNGVFYFGTSNEKEVYKQIKKNPNIEFTSFSKDFSWVRISGRAEFINDKKIKEEVLDVDPQVKAIYKSADNPVFEVFCLRHGEAVLADLSGNPPEKFTF